MRPVRRGAFRKLDKSGWLCEAIRAVGSAAQRQTGLPLRSGCLKKKMKLTGVIAIGCMCLTSCGRHEVQTFYLVSPETPEEMRYAIRTAEICKRETGETPWLVDYRYSQVLFNIPRTAFLRPDSQSSRVRRGRAFVNSHLQPYAQVARPNETFSSALEKPAASDRPFLIHGQFSDGDLVGIVTALRQTFWLEGHYILDVIRDPPPGWFGPYRVRSNDVRGHDVRGTVGVMTERGASFNILFLNFTNQVWQIVSSGAGIR